MIVVIQFGLKRRKIVIQCAKQRKLRIKFSITWTKKDLIFEIYFGFTLVPLLYSV